MAARHEEGCYQVKVSTYFLVCNVPSNKHVGLARGTVFQEVRPGACFQTVDFDNEKLGGAIVVRLEDIFVIRVMHACNPWLSKRIVNNPLG